MLIKLTVENYRSIKESVEIDFTATALKELEEENISHGNNVKLLKCMAMYGANSSGKSNILSALTFMRWFIMNSSKDQSEEFLNVDPFRLSTTTEDKPSKFEIQFLIDGTRYRYGFEVDFSNIHSEWLFYTKVNKENKYFYRIGQGISVEDKFSEGVGLEDKTRPDALFLSVTSQFNGRISMSIVRWINNIKYVLDDNKKYQNYSARLFEKAEYKNIIKKYLSRADLGFSDIQMHKVSMPDWNNLSPEVREMFATNFKNENILMTEHIKYDAEQKPVSQEFFNLLQSESLGTQKYFAISGLIIESLMHGRVLIIDEFDSRLHPLLCMSIIKLFNSKANNFRNAQLIFTAHNTSFLNKSVFRRDQIVIVNKDRYGATHTKSLAQIKVRSDEAYEKNYLQGEYSGIPDIKHSVNLFDPF